MSQNRRSKMGLTSNLSCFYDAFYFDCVSFSLMMSLTIISSMTSVMMIVLGTGYLVRDLFIF